MRGTKRICLILLVCCFTSGTAVAQIVNIEKSRMQSDTTGWLGSAGAALSLIKNTQTVFSAGVDAHLQYKSEKSLYLILANYGFLKGAGNKFVDNTFLHLRYNYKLNSLIRWEVFTQYQKNVITKIKSRYLMGTGPRFKILSNKIIRMYAASLIMFEHEKESTPAKTEHNDIRSSTYVSFTITPNNYLELISTSFFQPRLNNLSDFRILNQIGVIAKAGKRLSLRINWNYLYDSSPVPGIPSDNYAFSTGLEYEF